jgi:hypothetical protein
MYSSARACNCPRRFFPLHSMNIFFIPFLDFPSMVCPTQRPQRFNTQLCSLLAHSTNWLLLPRRLADVQPVILGDLTKVPASEIYYLRRTQLKKNLLVPRLYRTSKRNGVDPFKWVITSKLNQLSHLRPHRTAQPSPAICLCGNIDSYIYTLRREGDSSCACLLDNYHRRSEISNLRR